MDSFTYISVLLSIVLGLAITQVLLGLRGLILTRAKVKLYTPTLIWAVVALLIPIQAWWASFAMREQPKWTFLALLVIMLEMISIYMVAALVLPDITGESYVDLRQHFFAHRSWFFGAQLARQCGIQPVKESGASRAFPQSHRYSVSIYTLRGRDSSCRHPQ